MELIHLPSNVFPIICRYLTIEEITILTLCSKSIYSKFKEVAIVKIDEDTTLTWMKPLILYYDNKFEKGHYVMGLKEGTWTHYNEVNCPDSVVLYYKGILNGSYIDSRTGSLITGTYINGKKEGKWEYINGRVTTINFNSNDKIYGMQGYYFDSELQNLQIWTDEKICCWHTRNSQMCTPQCIPMPLRLPVDIDELQGRFLRREQPFSSLHC